MPAIKIYKCCICHSTLKEYKPIRLVKEKYGKYGYNQYNKVCHYDFCKRCYTKFNNWINKHKEDNNGC